MSLQLGPGDDGGVRIVDCTLREGEQTPGVWLEPDEKLEILRRVAAAGVRVVDAAMPAVAREERTFLERAVAERPDGVEVAASVRARRDEIRLAASTGCRTVFLIVPTSRLHREVRLGLDRDGLARRIRETVGECRERGLEPLVVAEDASRTELEELVEWLGLARESGADAVCLCDTVGIWTPRRTAAAVRRVCEAHPELAVGVHCHDDFGMATANTVAAVEAGASWPTVTVNGIGERAGNASLVETALACSELLGRDTGLDATAFPELSRRVEALTGLPAPLQQPFVGATAFRHESGIHVHGVLKDPATYEPLDPARLGAERALVVGKHTGRELLRAFARSEGMSPDAAELDLALELLKARRPEERRAAYRSFSESRARYLTHGLGLPVDVLRAVLDEARRRLAARERAALDRSPPSRSA